jgi:hypothetical protein
MNETEVADRLLRGVENTDFSGMDTGKLMARLRKLGAIYADSPQLETCQIFGPPEEHVHAFLDIYYFVIRLKKNVFFK